MIQNVVFDMGRVLLAFDRRAFLDRLDVTEAEKQLLLREVFFSVEWVKMDRGDLDEPEAEASICRRLPEHLHPAVHELVSKWDVPLLPVPGMEELVRDLKQAGYGIYLLSNASRRQRQYWPRLPVSQYFDDTFISAEHGILKPQMEIYEQALASFGLAAEGCIFIDDAPANVEGGMRCGMAGLVFHGDAALLRRQLRAAGLEV